MSVLVSNHLEEERNIDIEDGRIFFRLTSRLKDPFGFITFKKDDRDYDFTLTAKYSTNQRDPVVMSELLKSRGEFHRRAEEISENPSSVNWKQLTDFKDWDDPNLEMYVSQ